MTKPLTILFAWICLISSCKCNQGNETSTGDKNMTDTASSAPVVKSDNDPNGANTTAKADSVNASTATSAANNLYKKDGSNRPKYTGKTPGEFPEGSDKILAEDDVKYLSEWGLKVMQNEIYARHGQTFPNDPLLEEHFKRVGWYHGANPNVSKKLTKIEKQNIAYLKSYQYKPGIQ